jgi:hypothetical protein
MAGTMDCKLIEYVHVSVEGGENTDGVEWSSSVVSGRNANMQVEWTPFVLPF